MSQEVEKGKNALQICSIFAVSHPWEELTLFWECFLLHICVLLCILKL